MALRTLAAVLLLLYPALSTMAEVRLETAVLEQSEKILITFYHDNSAEMVERNCHFNLFAADKRRDLKTLPGKGLSIATFYREDSPLSIIAVDLRKLSRKKVRTKKRNLYLRVLTPCEKATSALSKITPVSLPTYRNGRVKNIDRLIKRMKYHMRYATAEDLQNLP